MIAIYQLCIVPLYELTIISSFTTKPLSLHLRKRLTPYSPLFHLHYINIDCPGQKDNMDSPMMQDTHSADPSLRLDVDTMILDYLIFKANIGVFRNSNNQQGGGLGDGEAADSTERALEMVDGKPKTFFFPTLSSSLYSRHSHMHGSHIYPHPFH